MISEVKNRAQTHDSSTVSKELGRQHEQEIPTQENNFSAIEVCHESVKSVNAQIKLATELTFWKVEKLWALLTELKELDTTGNSQVTGFRRGYMPANSSDNRYNARLIPPIVVEVSTCETLKAFLCCQKVLSYRPHLY